MQENSSREDICNPLFMFRRSLISLKKKKFKQVDSTIFNSIWKGKLGIKRLALTNDYGGLRMPLVQTMIDTQRIDVSYKIR